jgi:hypothetical protein
MIDLTTHFGISSQFVSQHNTNNNAVIVIVLSDFTSTKNMEGMDGFSNADHLRKAQHTIISLSGLARLGSGAKFSL